MNSKSRLLTGMAIGLNSSNFPNLGFDPSKPFAACRICGAVYQHKDDRDSNKPWSPLHRARHDTWRLVHTKQNHSDHEVNLFRLSGRALTPEAARVLAPYGVVPISDLLDPETTDALRQAPRVPLVDAQS